MNSSNCRPKDIGGVANSSEPSPALASDIKQSGEPDDKDHKAAERRHWSNQDRAQWWMVAISALALLGAALGTFFAFKAFREAQRQADAIFFDQRPWLRVSLNFGSLKFSESGDAVITFETTIKNVGRSPARNLRERITARVVTEKEAINTIQEQRRQCDLAAEDSEFSRTDKGIPGAIIFPNEEAPNVIGASGWGSATVTKNTFDAAWPSADVLSFHIIGCYDYGLPSGDHGQTGFTYVISKNIGNGLRGGFTPASGAVPREEVLFNSDPFSSGYIR